MITIYKNPNGDSRYVDLDGKTWDGTPITSKIQEVQTKMGYLQGITIGWLWGDNVPHIDIEEYAQKIRIEVIEECLKVVEFHSCAYDGMYCAIRDLRELKERANYD